MFYVCSTYCMSCMPIMSKNMERPINILIIFRFITIPFA